jgi:hypothetical protein
MTPRTNTALSAAALLAQILLLQGCGGEGEARRDLQPPEGGSELAEGPVVIVGVTRPCSARFSRWRFANVLVWDDGVVLVGPLEELRWRWCRLPMERLAEVRNALHRAGAEASRPPALVKHNTAYWIVGCRYAGAFGVAWFELESGRDGLRIDRVTGSASEVDASALRQALGPLLDLVDGPRDHCLDFEGTVFRSLRLEAYGDLWGLGAELERRK